MATFNVSIENENVWHDFSPVLLITSEFFALVDSTITIKLWPVKGLFRF